MKQQINFDKTPSPKPLSPKKLASPKSDIVFKHLFGREQNIDMLADFLSSVLNLDPSEYETITIADPHLKQSDVTDKLGILDLKILTKTQAVIDVEIQVQDTKHMRLRTLFYAGKLLAEQFKARHPYSEARRTIIILICDYIHISENSYCHNCFTLFNKQKDTCYTEHLEINVLELPKLTDKDSVDNEKLFGWLTFFKSDKKEELEMIAKDNPPLKKAVGILMELSEDESIRMIEESQERLRMDWEDRVWGAREDGRAEGRKKEASDIALRALRDGLSVDAISSITGLSAQEITSLQQRNRVN